MIMLGVFLIAGYLTYHTFKHAKRIWEGNNKVGSVAVGLLAMTFLPIVLYIFLSK